MASKMKDTEIFSHTTGVNMPVWTHRDPFSSRPKFDTLKLNGPSITTDVCVVGAGITGLSVAYELVSRGQKVVLLEARDAISGESGRTSGHLSDALDDGFSSILSKHGRSGAKAAVDSHMWAIYHVGEVAKSLGIDCEYRQLPAYRISQYEREDKRRDHDIARIKEDVHLASSLGIDVSYSEDLAVRGWDGNLDQRGGAVYANQAAFHPTLYLVGLLNWLRRQPNFSCHTNTRVSSVEETKDGVKVQTSAGNTVECSHAVEATCVPLQKLSIIGEMAYNRTYVIAIRVPKGTVEDCLIYDTADPYRYVRLTGCDDRDDYMIVGGCDHKVGQDDPTGRFEELESWIRSRFTRAGTVDYRWSGQIYEPMDYMAFIGKNQGSDRVYVATGDSGNGLTHGVIAGKVIADGIEGKENPWAALYSPRRILSIAKSAPSVAAHAAQINTQYKKIFKPDIQDIEDLAAGAGGVMMDGIKPLAVYKDENGVVTRMSAVCPHMKGVVCWNPAEKSFDCPVHGSRFSEKGLCLNGPAKTELASI